jgi:hypothetical protein
LRQGLVISPGCPQTCHPSTSASCVLGLQVDVTTPSSI